MKNKMIKIGNFFFSYRNKVFPIIIIALFMIAFPPLRILGSSNFESVTDVLAVVLAISGLVVRGIVIGYAYIKRGGLQKKVYAENLVTQGMFSLSRNPLYFGNMLIYAGVFLLHGDPVVAITGIGLFWFIYQCIIYAEENYLETKFGKGYKEYCQDVPRWIPQFGKFRTATQDMNFNFRRAIIKDYSTITSTVLTLCLVGLYEHAGLNALAGHWQHLQALAGIMVMTLIAALITRILKKRKILTTTG